MLPLTNLFVLDFSQGPSGGIATMILADFGAEVLKVDGPDGDRFESQAAAPMWLRGKRRAVLDGSAEHLRGEIERADVVLTSGPLADLRDKGLDYTTLSQRNARVVYCHISAMGPPGGGRTFITGRLKRHYNNLLAADLQEDSMQTIFRTLLEYTTCALGNNLVPL